MEDQPVQIRQEIRDTPFHCGKQMKLRSSQREVIDNTIYKVRYWKCLLCGLTYKTTNILPRQPSFTKQ